MTFLKQSKFSDSYRALCLIAAFVLLFINVGDIHSHYCLDGQEPAVTLHFENLNGHPEHEEDEQSHNDYEFELSTSILKVKSSSSSHFFIASTFPVVISVKVDKQLFQTQHFDSFIKKELASFLPPLRAPPITA